MSLRCYLDHNATSPLADGVAAAVARDLEADCGNPASPHAEGRRARAGIELARSEVAALVGAAPDEIVFTSGGSEANAAGIWGLVAGEGSLAGRDLLLSAVEHPAVRAMGEELARFGVAVETMPVQRSGLIDLDALEEALERRPGATLAVQLVNSETGVIQPIETVARLAAHAGARLHCDAVQAAGKVALAAGAWGVATLAIGGHKFGAPTGVGALIVRHAPFAALIPGSQERHRRGGTENLPGIAGLAVAARHAAACLADWAAIGALRDRLELEVLGRIPGTSVYASGSPRVANTSCLGLPEALKGGAAVAALDLEGFAVSAGPACSSGVERGSPTVQAMGFDRAASERTLRVSMGLGTGLDEIMALVAALERVTQRSKGGGT